MPGCPIRHGGTPVVIFGIFQYKHVKTIIFLGVPPWIGDHLNLFYATPNETAQALWDLDDLNLPRKLSADDGDGDIRWCYF